MNLTLYLNRLVSSSRYGLSAEMGSSIPFRAKFRSLQSLQTRPTRREARGSAAAQQRSSTAAQQPPSAPALPPGGAVRPSSAQRSAAPPGADNATSAALRERRFSGVGDGAAHFSQARADIAAVKSSWQRAVTEPMNPSGCRADAARTARVNADNHQQAEGPNARGATAQLS